MAAVPVDIIAGSIITPGFVEPAAALIVLHFCGYNVLFVFLYIALEIT